MWTGTWTWWATSRAGSRIWGNYLQLFLNDGTGSFTLTSGLTPTITPPAGTINSFDVADYTGDGAPDLWLGNQGGPVIALVNTYVDPEGAPWGISREPSGLSPPRPPG